MIGKLVRISITFISGALSYQLAYYILHIVSAHIPIGVKIIGWSIGIFSVTIIGGLLGYMLAPYLTRHLIELIDWAENSLQKVPTQDIFLGSVGLAIALLIANLLVTPFSALPWIGPFLPVLSSIILGYMGSSIAVKKKEELVKFINIFLRVRSQLASMGNSLSINPRKSELDSLSFCKVIDSSVIIDGRILDVCKAGFLEGTLVVPSFILDELRHISDSSDTLTRNRGRKGLDILNELQKQPFINVHIYEDNLKLEAEIDNRLLKLAQILNGSLLTADYSLNEIAKLQKIKVLNINELAKAIKSVVLPGEEVLIKVAKEGKESNQGLGYLEDGTMIVVEEGRKYIGELIPISIVNVLQTSAGRMVFAKPKVCPGLSS